MILGDKLHTFNVSGGQKVAGFRRWNQVVMPWSGDDSPAAARYRRRNAGKGWWEYHALGVPYATGARWTAPAKATSWPSNPYPATTGKRVAHQASGPLDYGRLGWRPNSGRFVQPFSWRDHGVVESEDCYLLDIITPHPYPGAGLPVRVHFHSGGNTFNPRNLPRYTCARRWVDVLVEYPLSTFGFFTHPSFGAAFQPNIAYLAMLAALDWVQDHIADFGGDPANVMIEGASAGGAAVSFLVPQHSGRFHRVMAHSGGGTGRRFSRAATERRGDEFWWSLLKDRPAYFDPSVTIAEIAEEHGVATALRLGPSPAQISAWGDPRNVYTFAPGKYTTTSVGAFNPWPVQDGVLVAQNSQVQEILAGRWDSAIAAGVPYAHSWVSNEASLVGNAADYDDAAGRALLAGLGVTSAADQDEVIALLTKPGDRWQRLAFGHVIFGYGCERQCREYAARGGNAYYIYFSYDQIEGNGSNQPGHDTQSAAFIGRFEWQAAQGETVETLRIGAEALRLQEYLHRATYRYCATGDFNANLADVFPLDLFSEDELTREMVPFVAFDVNRPCNHVRNSHSTVDAAQMVIETDHQKDVWDIFDAHVGY